METAIGVFASRDRAEDAVKELLQRNVPEQAIVFLTRSENELLLYSSPGSAPFLLWVSARRRCLDWLARVRERRWERPPCMILVRPNPHPTKRARRTWHFSARC